jgi:hypothetical protein
MQRKSQPLTWRFKGVSDALDDSAAFSGAMSALTNLIPDPTTSLLWQCRPAAVQLFNFNTGAGPFSSGFSPGFQHSYFPGSGVAGFISVFRVIGNIAYGMMADSAIPGHDAPFAFNLLSGTGIAVGGTINATTTPTSLASTGAWTPPQMALIGTKLMVAHAGFTGVGGNFVGWFDLTNPLLPVWNAGNLTGLVQFTVAPTGVVQFFNRAYYIHNLVAQPAVIFSDVLNATNVTNANQVLTFGDNVQLSALGALPLSNQLGGIIQSVMVFKGVSNIYQITGDAALTTSNPLSINSLNVSTGTLAPNSVCSTSKGLAFIAPDGLRIIDFNASVSDPIGEDGKGISVPFISTAVPSRVVANCNGNTLRVTTQNAAMSGSPSQEYWFDFSRGIWTGPHSFPASLIQPYNNTFIMTPVGINASLWQSDYVQSGISVFVENSQQMTWNAATALLPDADQITNNAMTEATMDFAVPSNIGTISVSASDQASKVIDTVNLASSVGGTTLWGAFVWGVGIWGGAGAPALAPYQLQWHQPIVFSRMKISMTGQSAAGVKLGALHLRYQQLNIYTNTAAAA